MPKPRPLDREPLSPIWVIHGQAENKIDIPNLADLCARLKGAGYAPHPFACIAGKIRSLPKTRPCAILISLGDESAAFVPALTRQLRAKFAPHDIAIVTIAPPEAYPEICAYADTTLLSPVHAGQITARTLTVLRVGELDRELKQRALTISETTQHAIDIDSPAEQRRMRLLIIGRPAPAFLEVLSALEATDVDVVAAYTSFTAFDYLHAEDFDAVLLSALSGDEPAFTIASTMRRNSRLYSVPTLLLIGNDEDEKRQSAYISNAIERGFHDVIVKGAPLTEIASRVIELAGGHLAQKILRERFARLKVPGIVDPRTGLYEVALFHAHLKRLGGAAVQSERGLSVGVIKLLRGDVDMTQQAFQEGCLQIAAMIPGLVRLQDFAAALTPSSFSVIFPNTSAAETEIVMKRVCDIIHATAFESQGQSYLMRAEGKIVSAAPEMDRKTG